MCLFQICCLIITGSVPTCISGVMFYFLHYYRVQISNFQQWFSHSSPSCLHLHEPELSVVNRQSLIMHGEQLSNSVLLQWSKATSPCCLCLSPSLAFSIDGCNINEHILARMLVRPQANPVSLKPHCPRCSSQTWASISLFTNCYKRTDRSFGDPRPAEGRENAARDAEVAWLVRWKIWRHALGWMCVLLTDSC